MNLILIGPPGSGKSTQGKLLADELGSILINVGDLLYFSSLGGGEEAKAIKEKMKVGGLVDEELTIKIVEDHLKDVEKTVGVIIDGFPRNLHEAKKFNYPIDYVIYYQVSDKVTKERLLKRSRGDDTLMVIEKRIDLYHQETEPILEFYASQNILLTIDGEKKIDEIFNETIDKLKSDN